MINPTPASPSSFGCARYHAQPAHLWFSWSELDEPSSSHPPPPSFPVPSPFSPSHSTLEPRRSLPPTLLSLLSLLSLPALLLLTFSRSTLILRPCSYPPPPLHPSIRSHSIRSSTLSPPHPSSDLDLNHSPAIYSDCYPSQSLTPTLPPPRATIPPRDLAARISFFSFL